ncbi:MAG: hypothetical protein M5U14_13285 [Acidimicrobiia bacterium]|nr:hypothetical protein [Acidimicrobiia bacterium]
MGLLDKVKATAQQVGEKAQQGMKAGQEKIEDVRLKKKIGDLKGELGDTVYRQRTVGASPELAAEVDRLVAEIQSLEQELADEGGEQGTAAEGPVAEEGPGEPTP